MPTVHDGILRRMARYISPCEREYQPACRVCTRRDYYYTCGHQSMAT